MRKLLELATRVGLEAEAVDVKDNGMCYISCEDEDCMKIEGVDGDESVIFITGEFPTDVFWDIEDTYQYEVTEDDNVLILKGSQYEGAITFNPGFIVVILEALDGADVKDIRYTC